MGRKKLIRTLSFSSVGAIALVGGAFLAWSGWKNWQTTRDYERVRTLAAMLANDEFEARLIDDRWHWGAFEAAAFFSAEVSFRKDDTGPQVRVFWATDTPHPTERLEQHMQPPQNETLSGVPFD